MSERIGHFVMSNGILLHFLATYILISDSIDYTFDEMPLLYLIDQARYISIYSYVFTNLGIAIERTLASFMLKTYEDMKHKAILVFIFFFPWICAGTIEYMLRASMRFSIIKLSLCILKPTLHFFIL